MICKRVDRALPNKTHRVRLLVRFKHKKFRGRGSFASLFNVEKGEPHFSLLESRAVPAKKKRGLTQLIRRPFRRSQPPRSPRPLARSKISCFCPCGFPPAFGYVLWVAGGVIKTRGIAKPSAESARPSPSTSVEVCVCPRLLGPLVSRDSFRFWNLKHIRTSTAKRATDAACRWRPPRSSRNPSQSASIARPLGRVYSFTIAMELSART